MKRLSLESLAQLEELFEFTHDHPLSFAVYEKILSRSAQPLANRPAFSKGIELAGLKGSEIQIRVTSCVFEKHPGKWYRHLYLQSLNGKRIPLTYMSIITEKFGFDYNDRDRLVIKSIGKGPAYIFEQEVDDPFAKFGE